MMGKRDNLKYKTMAQYKAIRGGDILTFEMIDQNVMRRPSLKGLALSNKSIEAYEREIQDNDSDFYDRMSRKDS